MSREYTNRLIELCEDGVLSKEQVFDELMSYLSESDIRDFCIEGFAGEIEGCFKDLEE
jgi:hypothetical protein